MIFNWNHNLNATNMSAVAFCCVFFLIVSPVAGNPYRALKDKVQHGEDKNRPEFTCRSICSGSYDLCLLVSKNITDQMLCLRFKLSCVMKCPGKFIDKHWYGKVNPSTECGFLYYAQVHFIFNNGKILYFL